MKLIIGSHVGVSGQEMLLGAVKDTIHYGANAFMFYTGAPQNTLRKPIDAFLSQEAHALMRQHQIDPNHVIVHAPYIINMANTTNERVIELAREFLLEEFSRVAALGFKYLVIHPGSHVGVGIEQGQNQIITIVNEVLEIDKSNVVLLFETMSGKGSEIGFEINHIQHLIANIQHRHRVGICLDTCHLHDAGFSIDQFDDILQEIDDKIGLSFVKAVHVNDSKNLKGSKKDRHENIGFGQIGFEALKKVIYHPRLVDIPKILETPWIDDYAPYKEEIAMIKSGNFNPLLKDEILLKKG